MSDTESESPRATSTDVSVAAASVSQKNNARRLIVGLARRYTEK